MRSINLLFLMLCLTPFFMAAEEKEIPWKDRHAEGWAWYHDFPSTVEPKLPEAPEDPKLVIAKAKADLDQALSQALVNPTEENILAYLILQKKWVDQSSLFSKNWQRVILEHPEVASLHPTTQYGAQVHKEVKNKEKKSLIKNLAKQNALLFFYEGRNPASQAFSMVVKHFSSENNWETKAVSMDGFILRDFPLSLADPTIATEMNVNHFPALFLVNLKTQQATPIAFGMVTVSQIEENISIQYKRDSHD